ncbi:MAG TPA: dihydrolipoamide acetyltransferase family protein [Trebonia sp.]|nr:dihydrolipoamide acetyltransferase family protein [Trebonia sp.]
MIEIKMPRLSDTMEEGAISTWRKHPGDPIAVGDVLVEIETDKAVMEYEAYQAGILSKILVDEGQVVGIGAAIALVDDGSGESVSEQAPTGSASTGSADTAPAATVTAEASALSVTPAATTPDAAEPAVVAAANGANGANGTAGADARLIASPLVRKLARDSHLDLSRVHGTGPGGRIIRADISDLLGGAASATSAAPAAGPVSAAPAAAAAAVPSAVPAVEGTHQAGGVPAAPGEDEARRSRSVPVSQVRRVIARRLSASAREIPHYYVTAAADAEDLMALRATLNAQLTEAGRARVSVNDLLIRAVALALRGHPEVNVSYIDDSSTTMLIHDRVNIGVAVAAESGLIVPVITDADTKTVTQIGAEAKRLVALAGERKLTPAELTGGTFTISNLGMFGVEDFTAIINPPEAAILAVGATTREPAVVGDEIVPRYKLRYTMSSDHRVIDGALAAQFLKTLTRLVEHPWMIVA